MNIIKYPSKLLHLRIIYLNHTLRIKTLSLYIIITQHIGRFKSCQLLEISTDQRILFLEFYQGSNWNCRRTRSKCDFGRDFKYLMQYQPIFKTLLGVVQAIQFTVPALIGALIAMKFNLTPLAIAVVASASYVGSGAAQFKNGVWIVAGIGDLINTMITAAIAVLFILLIEERVGSMALIVFPTIVGGLSATIGIFYITLCEINYYRYWKYVE